MCKKNVKRIWHILYLIWDLPCSKTFYHNSMLWTWKKFEDRFFERNVYDEKVYLHKLSSKLWIHAWRRRLLFFVSGTPFSTQRANATKLSMNENILFRSSYEKRIAFVSNRLISKDFINIIFIDIIFWFITTNSFNMGSIYKFTKSTMKEVEKFARKFHDTMNLHSSVYEKR